MHQMKLTNKQIQEILVDVRKQLKNLKTIDTALSIDFKFPSADKEAAKLIISMPAWRKMTALINECDKEIAWHGVVSKERNVYTIEDILVFPQTVTGCTVTSDETEYSLWLANQPDEIFNKLRFHGHSHVNMGVTPSGVDTTYQEDILRNLNDFYIFMIWNKKGDHWCAIYDLESNMAYNTNDIEVITPETGQKEWAKEMMKQFVKEPVQAKPKAAAKKKSSTPITDEIMSDYDYYYRNVNDWWEQRHGQK